jgi:hypothetical protein
MEWITKNLKWITIIVLFLFLFKTCESCNKGSKIKSQEVKLTNYCDSVTNSKNHLIDSLQKENNTKDYLIKDLSTELKIAGIKYDEAQKRSDAIQKTIKDIRTNTTIEIKK